MHPELFKFVNSQFYCNQLKPVPLKHQSRSIEELYPTVPPVKGGGSALLKQLATRRTIFVDCKPIPDGLNDKVNSAEAKAVARVIETLAKLYEANGRTLSPDDVGIIVPYRNQISMVRTSLRQRGLTPFLNTTIDTVERYQGSQRDIIIYSFTVRHVSQLDFLTSSLYKENDNGSDYWVDRKLNVALTRSREQLIVIGNKQLLKQVPVYKIMLDEIQH